MRKVAVLAGIIIVSVVLAAFFYRGDETVKWPASGPVAQKVVILGFDGFEPTLYEKWRDEGKLPNLKKLEELGGYNRLATTFPSQSPVAWSTFATGNNPGKHNVFDFIIRDPATYMPRIGMATVKQKKFGKPEILNNRVGEPFWETLSKNGVKSAIVRVPLTFPATPVNGTLLSGLGVPDVRGTIGTFSYYTTQKTSYKDNDMAYKLVILPIAAYVLTTALAAAFSGCAAVGAGPQKPTENIVFITLDTVGAGHLSCYGYNRQTTPNLDKIAAEGVQFTNAYTPMPYTLPSLTSMFTSKYPWVHGIVNNYPSRSGLKFPVLPEQLRNRGYVTGAFVPTDFLSEENTHFKGFGTYNIGSPSYNHGKYYAYSDAAAQTKKAVAWLEKHKKSNMFLWVHYLDPHFPYDAPEPYSAKFSSQFNDIVSPRIKNLNYGTGGIPMRERSRGVQARNSTDEMWASSGRLRQGATN